MSDYFNDLAAVLRDRGVSQERITVTIDDLITYLQESGTEPEEEFGLVADFAPQLGIEPETRVAAPAASTSTWVWTADIFIDEQRLNEFGEQGWEVETVDKRGMFVSYRDPEQPQRWGYRREVVMLQDGRDLVERLATDGWEPCGTWLHYGYFKRPKAASVGPAAEIGSPPPAPSARIFLSKRLYLLVAPLLIFAVLTVGGIGLLLTATTSIDSGDFAIGVLIGVIGLFVVLLFALRKRDR